MNNEKYFVMFLLVLPVFCIYTIRLLYKKGATKEGMAMFGFGVAAGSLIQIFLV